MLEQDLEVAIKVLLVGNGAVGKSSMIQRYCQGTFTRNYKRTIGVDFLERRIQVNDQDVLLMLWDTAGQEVFNALTKAYYRGAQACVIVYSIADRDSFEAVEKWKKQVENEVDELIMVLVENKMDLYREAMLTREEASDLAARLDLQLFQTSAKENANVDEVFQYIAERYLTQTEEAIPENLNLNQSPSLDFFITDNSPVTPNVADRVKRQNFETVKLHRKARVKQLYKGRCLLL